MNANQAIEIWNTRETVDALQPWEVAEMLSALTARVEELEAAQKNTQPTVVTALRKLVSCPQCLLVFDANSHTSHIG